MTSDKVTFNGVGDFDPHSPSSEGTPNVPVASVAGSGNYVKGAAQKDAHHDEGTTVACLIVIDGRISTIGKIGEYDQSTVRWDPYDQFDLWIT